MKITYQGKDKMKNFVYLDVEKLYSLSSQVFEGITEYILTESGNSTEEKEQQKGPVGSGRVLADILKQSDVKTERKYLHDHSYNIFENELNKIGKVLELSVSEGNTIQDLEGMPFVRVKAKVTFNDVKSIRHTMENFNEIGKAMACVTTFAEREELKLQHDDQLQNTKDRNQKNKINGAYKKATDLEKIAKERGLYQDPDFLKSLSYMLSYGFDDQFEVKMELENSIISANLKRECLREKENLLIRKYSRKTEVEFVIFGVVTQFKEVSLPPESNNDSGILKLALANMIDHMSHLESTFTGRLENEIIIDPIALYTEI
ncbi:hypothetical protein M3P05_20150 [Sansalvadorimonas sp. 2012CJ34-2]|uniref:Uncharacterized protein n=1 Tax=Parendozoicomonas callyspongiae TaxID=2942213 RepID=A0ABT0PLI9_9GAMM|nr:hypothetical protein [Sansalvadorimonas sp. 2012CJ34-2]MCL6272237.1 hypothetical protein [Sansalvadorimonas sp. 2012CJ34-2]